MLIQKYVWPSTLFFFFFFVKRGTTIHWISFFRSFSLVLLHANNRTRYWRGEFCIELPSNQKAKKIGNVSWIPVPAVTNINNSILSPNSEVFLQISNFTLQLWKSSNIIWQLHGNLKASLKQIYHCRQMSQRRRLQINWNRPSKKVNGDRLYQIGGLQWWRTFWALSVKTSINVLLLNFVF